MADSVRDVPHQYGEVLESFHPRIRSYGRRMAAAVPTGLLSAVLAAYLFAKRPAVSFVVLAAVVIGVSLVVMYSYLRPQIMVLTRTHLLRGRMVGWKAVARTEIHHTVWAQRVRPREGLPAQASALARFRNRGVPGLWFLDARGRAALRCDGRLWDGRTLAELSTRLTPTTVRYEDVALPELARAHPGMVGFTELHPRFRSTVLTVLCLVILGLILLLHARPDLLGALYS